MKELSLNILDIAQNSVKAKAKNIDILIREDDLTLEFSVSDDGRGMSEEFLSKVTDPFTTTRTTRKVGLGLPLLKMEAEQTGGFLDITSKEESRGEDHGTKVRALFKKDSIDYIPLGDIIGTLCVLVQGADQTDYVFTHEIKGKETVYFSTKEMREMLKDLPLSTPEVIEWLRDFLEESYGAQRRETLSL